MNEFTASFTQFLTTLDLPLDRSSQLLCENLLAEARQQQRDDQAAHMRGQLYPAAMAGQLLAMLHQGNLLSAELSPQLQQAEAAILAEMTTLFQLPLAHFTPGGSVSNLEALWLAKQSQPARKTVYASENCHFSISKACDFLDLDLQLIKTDQQHQLDIAALQNACQKQLPLAIIATAGTTGTGHFDPLSAIAQLAEQCDSWLHIDAAWGGFLALLNDQHIRHAAEQADSLCFDPHKSLGQPRPCGLLFYRRPLPKITGRAAYLAQQPDSRIIGSRGGENFLPLWLTWQQVGLIKLQADLAAKLAEAQTMADLLKDNVSKLLFSETGIVCFQHDADLSVLQKAGVISQTHLNGEAYFRLVFADKACRAETVFKRLAPFL